MLSNNPISGSILKTDWFFFIGFAERKGGKDECEKGGGGDFTKDYCSTLFVQLSTCNGLFYLFHPLLD